ncbi:MAG: DUF917 domain-containing protein [Candidatus Rokuibacteriota bacterium]|nr:MAG: DUF917 domain-containing protein [Candidatus Rokubacteria bacterium]
MAPLRDVSAAEIESLAIGAWILGTGGGGSPYLALLNMRRLYRDGVVVRLMDPMDLADDDLVAIVSNMGAPLVGQERLTDPRTIERAVRMMEEYLNRRFTAVMSLEIGGGNSIQPFMAAAMLGLPVVDGDCMGRAFPEAQMTSFAIHDLPMYPLTLADVRDNAVIVARAQSWTWMERLSRTACVAVGSIAGTCKAPRTGKEVKECGILYTTSKAMRLGQAVQAARREHRDPVQAVIDTERGLRLFTGKVQDVARRATEGFLRGTAALEGLDADRGHTFSLAFQNCVAVGSIAGTCKAPRTGKEVKECGILYTTSKAMRLGQAVQAARREHRDPVQAVIDTERGLRLFTGKVQDVARRATEGFLRGTAALEGLDADRGHTFSLAFQNEFAVGWLDGAPRVTTPDLICVLDTVSGDAIGTETLRYGQRVTVVALPAAPILLTPKGLEHVGPRAFGYDLDFRSVFA